MDSPSNIRISAKACLHYECDQLVSMTALPVTKQDSFLRLLYILHKFKAKTAFDAEVAVSDADVHRRGDLHDAVVLRVKRQRAADAAVRADRIRLILLRFIPCAGFAHVMFALEHESAGRTDANTV